MKREIPTWAMRRAGPEDREAVRAAHVRGVLRITWPDRKGLRHWAKQHKWQTPWFDFDSAFLNAMLESDERFASALDDCGIELHIPKKDHAFPPEKLSELDALYGERSLSGRPVSWGSLVEELRDIRRAVEAGVVVSVGDQHALRTWQTFYDWAHARYHALEDGSDHWIGDDNS